MPWSRITKTPLRWIRKRVAKARSGGLASNPIYSKAYDTISSMFRPLGPARARAKALLRNAGVRRGRRMLVVKPNTIKTSVGVLSQSVFKAKRKPTPQVLAMERVGAPQVAIYQSTQSIASTFGFQAYGNISYLDQIALNQMSQKVPTGSTGTIGYNIGLPFGPRRFVLESSLNETTFTNMTTAGCEVELYDIACKRDIAPVMNTVIVGNGVGTPYSWGGQPALAWDAGVCAGEGLPYPQSVSPAAILGSTPFDSQFFRDYFKVKKRTIVMLPQGGSHRHVVNLSPNKLIDETLFNSSSIRNFSGLTMFTLIRVRGLPVADTADGSFLTTTGETQLNVVSVVRNKYTFVANTSNALTYQDNMVTPASASIVNIGSGSIETQSRTG